MKKMQKKLSWLVIIHKGIRGVAMSQRGNDYTRDKDYFKNIDDNICLIPQLETVKSIKIFQAYLMLTEL